MASISIHIGSKYGSWFHVDFDSSTLTIHADDIADLRQLARDIMDALPSEQADYDGRDVPGWEGGFAANH